MGKDKFENEFLIKYCQNYDIWFHVDNLSSAHVYLRLNYEIKRLDEIPAELVAECC